MAVVPGRPVVALVGALGGEEAGTPIAEYLERRGFETRAVRSGWEAEALLAAPDLDIVVIEMDGDGGASLALLKQFARPGGLSATTLWPARRAVHHAQIPHDGE